MHKSFNDKYDGFLTRCVSKTDSNPAAINLFRSRFPEFGYYAVENRIRVLGLSNKQNTWTEDELLIAKNVSKEQGLTVQEKWNKVSLLTGRSVNAVRKKVKTFKEIRMTPVNDNTWSQEEKELLIKFTMQGMSRPDIKRLALPGRTTKSIEDKQVSLGITSRALDQEANNDTSDRFTVNNDDVLDAIQNITEAMSPMKETPREIYKHIKTDMDWIALVASGDWHIGNINVNFKALREDIDTVASTDGMYYVFVGDGTDNFTATSIPNGMHEQIISPRGARIAMGRLFKKIAHKMIAAIMGCHDAFTVKTADFNILEYLTDNLHIPYLGNGGTINIVVNDVTYRIAARHKYRFQSSLNLSHTCRQYVRHADPYADIVAIGHNHESYIGQEDIFQKPRIFVRTGGYKPTDRFAESLGYEQQDCWIPVVLLNTKKKEMRMASSIQEATQTLESLNNVSKRVK